MKISDTYHVLFAIVVTCLCFSSCNKQALDEELIIDNQKASYNQELVYDIQATNDSRSNIPVDVYLIMGQSNGVGAGTVSSIDNYDQSLASPFSNVLFAGRTSQQNWSTNPTFLGWGPLRARVPNTNDGFGCELSFGRRLYNHTPIYRNNHRKLAIIKSAVGSTTLLPRPGKQSWDQVLSTHSINYINGRINHLKNIGYTNIQIKGLIWIQGESDVVNHPHLLNQYPTKMVQLVNKIHNRMQGTQNMQVVMVGLNQSAGAWKSNATKLANLKKFNRKLYDLANSKPNYHYVSANKLEMINNTNVHYNGDGQILLGFRVSREFID